MKSKIYDVHHWVNGDEYTSCVSFWNVHDFQQINDKFIKVNDIIVEFDEPIVSYKVRLKNEGL